MLKNLLSRLCDIFTPQSYGSSLEEYIVKNRPTDIVDIERLTRDFDRNFFIRGF
jgi:hypothetical protein